MSTLDKPEHKKSRSKIMQHLRNASAIFQTSPDSGDDHRVVKINNSQKFLFLNNSIRLIMFKFL